MGTAFEPLQEKRTEITLVRIDSLGTWSPDLPHGSGTITWVRVHIQYINRGAALGGTGARKCSAALDPFHHKTLPPQGP